VSVNLFLGKNRVKGELAEVSLRKIGVSEGDESFSGGEALLLEAVSLRKTWFYLFAG
jgi:hypothetical protein